MVDFSFFLLPSNSRFGYFWSYDGLDGKYSVTRSFVSNFQSESFPRIWKIRGRKANEFSQLSCPRPVTHRLDVSLTFEPFECEVGSFKIANDSRNDPTNLELTYGWSFPRIWKSEKEKQTNFQTTIFRRAVTHRLDFWLSFEYEQVGSFKIANDNRNDQTFTNELPTREPLFLQRFRVNEVRTLWPILWKMKKKKRNRAQWIERTRVSSPWIGPFNYSLQRERERSMHTIESKPRMERLDRHRAERQTSLLTSPISPGNRALSLSPSFSIRISLCPGEIVITKGGKNASRSFRSRIDGLDSRMAAAVVVLEQPTTFPEARNKVEERERDWHLRRYTSESRK